MTDYRELFGISGLAQETNDGDGIRIAVLDTGTPRLDDILVCLSENLTSASDKDTGHATFIGSILFGHSPITGICSHATPCFIKVFDGFFASPDILARAIRDAIDRWHVDVINLSLGFSRSSPCPDAVLKACQYAFDKNVVVVAATGNDGGRVLWPAALPATISVGSTDGTGRDEFSNHGEVDFVVTGKDLPGYDLDGTVVKKSGTSFSAAVVTGMVALVVAKMKKRDLPISVNGVRQELMNACLDLKDPGYDSDTGFGFPFAVSKAHENKSRVLLMFQSIYATILKLVKKAFSLIRRTKNHDK